MPASDIFGEYEESYIKEKIHRNFVNQVLFNSPISKPKFVPKKWGSELWLANNEVADYCGKILTIKADSHFSLHYHIIKNETFYLDSGDAIVILANPSNGELNYYVLDVGESIDIKVGQAHSVYSKSGCKLIESSSFHRDSDSYRVPFVLDREKCNNILPDPKQTWIGGI